MLEQMRQSEEKICLGQFSQVVTIPHFCTRLSVSCTSVVQRMHVFAPGKVHYKHKQGRWQSDIMMRLPGGEGWPTSPTRLPGRSPWQKVIWHSGTLPAKPEPPRLNCFLNAALKIHQISWIGQQTPVAIIVHLALLLKLRKP